MGLRRNGYFENCREMDSASGKSCYGHGVLPIANNGKQRKTTENNSTTESNQMKFTSNSSKRITGSLAVAALLCLPAVVPAATVNLAVNSSLSSLSLVSPSQVFGLAFGPQSGGSMTDFWSGTILANDLGAGQIAFTSGGSAISALLNPGGPYSTAPAPFPPGGDNYGVTASGTVGAYGFSTVNGAYRNLVLDINTSTATSGAAPGGGLTFTGGSLDWGAQTANAGATGGQTLMAGKSGLNGSPGLVSWDGTTLSLPVKFATTGANGLFEVWQGTIVATAVVPEPSTLALGALGMVGLIASRLNRSRRGV